MLDRLNQIFLLVGRRGILMSEFYFGGQLVGQTNETFNLMNFRAVATSGKVDVRQFAWTSFLTETVYLLLKKILPPPSEEDPFSCIKHTECGMD